MTGPLRLSEDELIELTDYRQPKRQLETLRAAGFWRARISDVGGRVILEREHYEAVCAGAVPGGPARKGKGAEGPKLQPAD